MKKLRNVNATKVHEIMSYSYVMGLVIAFISTKVVEITSSLIYGIIIIIILGVCSCFISGKIADKTFK